MDKFESLENEIWVDAKSFTTDYSGHYIVSNLGRCWSFKSDKFVGSWSNDGHWNVCLSNNEKETETMMIGRLMLISFGVEIPEHLKDLPTSKLHCMHLDGDSHNNHLENFQWGNNRENANEINARIRKSEAKKGDNHPMYGKHHTEETKRKMSEARKGDKCYWYGKYGKDCPNSKPILQYTLSGEFIKEWNCAMDASIELGINYSNMSSCASGKRPSAGGYIWKHKEEVA